MKKIFVSEDESINVLLEVARQENLLLTLPDGSEFILAQIDTFDKEIELARQNPELMELLTQRAKQKDRISLHDARKLLGLTES